MTEIHLPVAGDQRLALGHVLTRKDISSLRKRTCSLT
jgi:hypothetical protein